MTRIKPSIIWPTRNEFCCMGVGDLNLTGYIRSLDYPKWAITKVSPQDEHLPRLTRAEFAKTREDKLPDEMIITHARKPLCVVRSVM